MTNAQIKAAFFKAARAWLVDNGANMRGFGNPVLIRNSVVYFRSNDTIDVRGLMENISERMRKPIGAWSMRRDSFGTHRAMSLTPTGSRKLLLTRTPDGKTLIGLEDVRCARRNAKGN